MLRHCHLSIAAVGALSLALAACGKSPPPDPRTQPPLVRTTLVAPGNAPERVFTGTIAARVQGDLGFRVAGKVLERLVDTGQTVRRGQALLRLDPVDLKLAANAQQEAVAAARARAQQASDEEQRYRDLQGTGAVSALAHEQIKAAADSARAQLRAAEAQAAAALNASRYAELLADADGIVMETLAEPGQVVSAGQVVVRLAHAGRREAVVQLPETLRPALGSAAQARLFGREDVVIPARLRQLSDVADRATRTFEARYVLDAGAAASAPLGSTVTLRIGGTATATATATSTSTSTSTATAGKATLQVPIGAILDEGKGAAVWVVQGDQVRRQPVTVVQVQDGNAQVVGALGLGERIVALGAHLLSEGAQVRLESEAPSTATTSTASSVSTGASRE
ncbi:efflux transporter, RND family, MFP subunit [Delftia acidovorans SPH-1]|uniref:Efflux transporter, RND family, MFP subunit n=1 Tax=Delftia acidovorans (strain DSM 14801 / SPH-1) TaxID=398578 RepID=A9BXK6_DELAS|nr:MULTISPECIES: efflux RND transporter periplasmic adaptor subunit [Delftia]MCP4017856.1 efflux RND transporter periplasmic adaptor subunit [Delftia sp.]OLE94785.1 MAG: efflux transporter periplasmic adaptor subunit [Delftia sp. 13_1_40CM_3_66_6]ABX38282.1 efflux transporter, RND family, MFP subunit [Delftia acidovorans SPH-1]MCP4517480.1 efflux RND transporter periplasmic adaptor subunit [Delftia sp.]MCP4532279.1 efflux RND transporter periplasmic adaptor subunit [Delftia sp.]